MAGARLSEMVSELTGVLDRLKIPYFVGGSVASCIHGTPRYTQDIDLVIALTEEKINPLARALASAFYADERQMTEAYERGRSFNVIHFATSFKADLFPLGTSDFHASQMSRAEIAPWHPTPNDHLDLRIASAEDTVLQKLVWYRDGGFVSDRQWSDLLGIVTIRRLDDDYLGRWAPKLGVADLLAKLRAEAAQITSNE